ncbi:MAG: hypothetical protein HUU23_16265, partial [Caldilineales bacterium]|nr:hypothetical protein [Caldilineales bacterium]
MSAAAPAPLSMPDDMQARLAAAGVTDEASLQAALAADPALAADLQTFLEGAVEALPEMGVMALLAAFAQAENRQQMMEFWRGVPAGMEEDFMEAVEAFIAQAEAEGESETAQALAARLESFRQIHVAATQAQEARQELQEMPPTVRAVIAFIQAGDDAAAAALFAQQRALLQPYEAQQMLDEQVRSDDPAMQARIIERSALLRQLRGAAPTPAPTAALQSPISNPQGNLYQAGRDQHFFSAHAESGGVATVVNNLFIQSLERRWQPPQPQAFDARFLVDRPQEMDAVREALAQEGRVAVTGQTSFVAVQGMAGVGKTALARLLAQNPGDAYPDGVIWEELGPDFTAPEQAQAILRRWAGYATGFFGLPENLQQIFVFEPDAVRHLLAERPRLLVVLDNVWSLAAAQPLRQALPPGSHLLVTTRSQEIARGLGGGQVEVGRLSEAEAIELCARRLGW